MTAPERLRVPPPQLGERAPLAGKEGHTVIAQAQEHLDIVQCIRTGLLPDNVHNSQS